MNNREVLRSVFAFITTLMLCTSANALLFRAYLDSTGNDANPCTLPQPCRLLPAALNAVADGGEIWMLDSANYNTATVTISKSVSILAIPGAVGSVVALGGPAISITASSLTVALRNLVIVPIPGGGGTDGVNMTLPPGTSTLTVENCLIANLPGYGVSVAGTGRLKISNTIIRNNGNFAVQLVNGASAEISGTQMLANGSGGVVAQSTAASTTAIVSDSVISGGQDGVVAYSNVAASGVFAKIFVTRCTIEGSTNALGSQTDLMGSAVVAVSSSTIVNNIYAWRQQGSGSVIRTLGNNHITDNSSAIGVLTPTALQ